MTRLALLASAALAIAAAPVASRAATIATSLAGFQSGLGGLSIATTSTLGTLFAPITSASLVNGTRVGLSGAADTIDQPGIGVLPFSNGYSGQVIDSTTNTETLSFSSPLSAFGFVVQPDLPLVGSTTVSVTIRLADGTSTTLTNSVAAGTVEFVGYTGGPETGLTITTSTADFAFGQFLTATTAAVPEPASALVLMAGLLATAPLLRRRR